MHEFGLVSSILESVNKVALDAGATRVLEIKLSIGVMTEVVEEALRFAFDVLSEGTLSEGAELDVDIVEPRSRCLECNLEFTHDRFHLTCPACGSPLTELLAGREMNIDKIDVDVPED